MTSSDPLYLGFDLSTQQLKGLAVTSNLKVVYEAKFDFDADSEGFGIKNGVITKEEEHEVYAPVALWLQALDSVLRRLKEKGLDYGRVKGISGAGQQHGSVYWDKDCNRILENLDSSKSLAEQLEKAFSHPFSPNWQDASTQKECDAFDAALGGRQQLAEATGSKAHHRFTGPQILRFRQKQREAYTRTSRISLVSSFLASLFLGKVAPIDISDVCGMNLWDIKRGAWHEELIDLASGPEESGDLVHKLGQVHEDRTHSIGTVSRYMITRYGFAPSCPIAAFTGDNPATILALPLHSNDAIVSLGTSTTFLMSTPIYAPNPATHFFNHPTTPGLFMFMLCYKNGGLARERVRDAVNAPSSTGLPGDSNPWNKFDQIASATPILGQKSGTDTLKLGLYFPRPEIVPNVRAGEWHFNYEPSTTSLVEAHMDWNSPTDDVRAIIESQFLSLRLRSRPLVTSPGPNKPPQPHRIYLVGGGSQNKTIAKVAGEVLGGTDGVWKLDVGENACALGAAYKAVWTVERQEEESFEKLIGKRWQERQFAEQIANGYQKGVFERYEVALEAFQKMEEAVLKKG